MGFFSKKTAPAKAAAEKSDKKAATPATAPAAAAHEVKLGDSHRILVRPLMTEKGTALAKLNQYAFVVAPKANKLSIRQAVSDVYGVTVNEVRVINVRGKAIRTRSGYGARKDWRKAIVTLKKGDSIEIFAKA